MRERIVVAIVGAMLAGVPGWAQMHKVSKPQQVVRAVGVYEWTGDLAKPGASRLIPVSLFIDGEFQDAGVYMAQPVPFALESGNVYELKDAGADKGTVDLESARHLQTADGNGAGGWIGYGSFKAPAAPKLRVAKKLPPARTSGIVSSVKDTAVADRPTFGGKQGVDKTDGAPSAAPPANTTASSSEPSGTTPSNDPDRPVLSRPASETGGAPSDDPDRPTLKRRSPEEAKQAKAEAESDATGMVASLNEDPNRPKLHPGKPEGVSTGADLPKLAGTPKGLHQIVAVSDAVDREPHEFSRPWEDAAERAAILEKMETMARANLAAYQVENGPATPVHVLPRRATASSRMRRRSVSAPAPEALMDETLRSYTLSYGGDPTYVYMAHTSGLGAALRYVTVVAQTDQTGELKQAIASVTDETHLDRTPEMKFVDAVDADASNRASLLFELRAQSSRQFGLYRVIAGAAQQIFVSAATQ